MIKVFLISVLLIISVSLLSQLDSKKTNLQINDTVKLDPTYFILGSLSDYMGRFEYVDKKNQIDRYYPYEKPLMEFIESIIKNNLNLNVITVPDKLSEVDLYETFSPELSPVLNSYFNRTYLVIDSLKNKPELNCSYLTGRYYRYGKRINDSIYLIQMANSADHEACHLLLKRIGCTRIHFKYLKNIPAQFIYYFIPTTELKNYFDSLENEKKKLEDSYNELIRSKFKFSDENLKKIEEIKRKDYEKIIELFKNNGL
jgi:hypothetical protein